MRRHILSLILSTVFQIILGIYSLLKYQYINQCLSNIVVIDGYITVFCKGQHILSENEKKRSATVRRRSLTVRWWSTIIRWWSATVLWWQYDSDSTTTWWWSEKIRLTFTIVLSRFITVLSSFTIVLSGLAFFRS